MLVLKREGIWNSKKPKENLFFHKYQMVQNNDNCELANTVFQESSQTPALGDIYHSENRHFYENNYLVY